MPRRRWSTRCGGSFTSVILSQYETSLMASRVLIERPHWLTAQATLAASLWNLRSEDEARATVRKMLANHPNLTASRWAQGLPYRHKKDLDALITPLRLAGLPE